MQLTADFDNLTLRLAYPDAEGARALLEGARAQGAFLLDLPREPRAFYTYAVTVEAPGFEFAFEAAAVQVFPPQAPGAACSATF